MMNMNIFTSVGKVSKDTYNISSTYVRIQVYDVCIIHK